MGEVLGRLWDRREDGLPGSEGWGGAGRWQVSVESAGMCLPQVGPLWPHG